MQTAVQQKGWGSSFVPKSVQCLNNYNLNLFLADLLSAFVVAFAGLPMAMGYAIASGMPPQIGIYCTIVGGAVAALLGGSRCQITGPTAGFDLIVLSIIATHGLDGLFSCVLIAGIILVILGCLGLGSLVEFIPRPMSLGISNGIGIYLIISQLKNLFGLKIQGPIWNNIGSVEKIVLVYKNFLTFSWIATLLGLLCIMMILLIQKYFKKIPGAIIAMGIFSFIAFMFKLKIATIGTTYPGGMPQGFNISSIPHFRFDIFQELLSPALTIVMLVSLKSLVSASIADRIIEDKHNPNMELIGQGAANIASAFVGSIPCTGSISRTANNIRCGGRTPFAAFFVSIILLSVLLFAAPVAQHIPLTIISAIITVIGFNVGEWSGIPLLLKLNKADICVWFVTCALTAYGDLDSALKAGFILSVLLYVQKVSRNTVIYKDTEYFVDFYSMNPGGKDLHNDVSFYSITGPFLFGSTGKMNDLIQLIPSLHDVLILRVRDMTAIDSTGVQAFEVLLSKINVHNKQLILLGLREQPYQVLNKGGFLMHLGENNECKDIRSAMNRASELIEEKENELVFLVK